jgi:hypothetical protein
MYTQIGVELADGSSATIHQTGEGAERGLGAPGQRITIGWNLLDGQVLTE